MATLAKSEVTSRPLTASELLAIRGTPEFDAEYRRQLEVLSAYQQRGVDRDLRDSMAWDVPGWAYDAEL